MGDRLPDWQTLSLREKIGQMIVVRASGHLFDSQIRYPQWEPDNQTLQRWVVDLNVGGVILLGGSAAELSLRSRQLQAQGNIPLLIAADIEEGVGQRFAGATCFPPPMAVGSIEPFSQAQEYAAKMGAITAQEAHAIGINWILAPVVDVNNNPDNPVINVRSFGEKPETVSQLAAAFIRGAKPYPVLTTAKHFPGHGDTAADSHLTLPMLPHSPNRLAAVELPPFQGAISAGVDSVMTAHLLIPAWDAQRPATLSPEILTGQLRKNLGFEGLIVTDALVMGGVAHFTVFEEVCVLAVEAGADVLLMPEDPEAAIAAVYDAVQSGRIPEARIDASLQRLWPAKQKTLRKTPSAEALDFTEQLAQPFARETAVAIERESLQLGGSLPLPPLSPTEKPQNLIVVDNLLNCDFLGSHTPAIAVPKQLGYELQLIEQRSLNGEQIPPDSLIQVFSRGNPFRGRAGLDPEAQEGFKKILSKGKIRGLAIYGSPYILEWFLPNFPQNFPWIFSYGQMPLAQEIAIQALFEKTEPGSKFEAFI